MNADCTLGASRERFIALLAAQGDMPVA